MSPGIPELTDSIAGRPLPSTSRSRELAAKSGGKSSTADLDERRRALATGDSYYCNFDDEGVPHLHARRSWLTLSEVPCRLAEWEPDTESSIGGYISPYEDIGLELVRRVDARDSAPPGTEDREQAEKDLDEFLKSISVKLQRGRPPDGPDRAVLQALVDEGESLLDVCWQELHRPRLDPRARRVLERYGAATEDGQNLWAARLALPHLSRHEILALQALAADRRRRHETRATPRRIAVWLVARRLQIQPPTVSRKVDGSSAAEQHPRHNPVSSIADR